MKRSVLQIRIEAGLLATLKRAAVADRQTVTSYLTALMVKDLRSRGLLKVRKT